MSAWQLFFVPFLLGVETGTVEITVVERGKEKPVPSRIHLKNSAGKPVEAGKLPYWHDHFVCNGTVELALPAGSYTFQVERGPEYSMGAGSAGVSAGKAEKIKVELERLLDLPAEGWWPGELHVHRPLQDIELLMEAEDLHVAPVITWWNQMNVWRGKDLPSKTVVSFDGNRYYELFGGEDEREGGALLFFHLPRPLDIAAAGREHPSPLKFVAEARRQPGAWIDVEKPFWWDMPSWVSSGQVDSIGIANNHMCRGQMLEDEAWGKPRDTSRLPAPLGNGLWSQEIYYRLLNCGLRIPPSAGSASGVLPNPVGYNRVYVYLGQELEYGKWWEGLRAGRSFVTNGPLLRCEVEGKLPGHVFTSPPGIALDLEVKVKLTSRDPVRALEIVKNGIVERSIPFSEWRRAAGGTLGKVGFQESGWFLIRALGENQKTFRFASTAPYYVEVGELKRPVMKASAQFFLDWVNERIQRVNVDDPAKRQEVLGHHQEARRFWEEKVAAGR
jgi:hypothetical protein